MERLSLKIRLIRAVLAIGERILELTPGADWLRVHHYRLSSEKIPQGFDSFRFVVLSDIHAHRFKPHQEPLLEKIRALSPEVILCAGDWVRENYEGRDADTIRHLAAELVKIAPTYSILGNHEPRLDQMDELVEDLEKAGIRVLQDESILLGREGTGDQLVLTGLYPAYENDFYGSLRDSGIGDKLRGEYGKVVEDLPDRQAFQIVLAHRPELFPLYAELGMDLVFSGHAHGGLLKLPGGRRLLAPDQGLFPVYTHGTYSSEGTTMVVSEGLGGPRIGIRPELIDVTLISKQKG